MKPFRWDIKRREQLGGLVEGEPADDYDGFAEDLRTTAARILDAACHSDLAFIGRSPESLFDYLSGVLLDTSWLDRLLLVNLSVRLQSISDLRREHPQALAALGDHLHSLGIAPRQLVHRERPLSLIDLVSSGSTFRNLNECILEIARHSREDLQAVRRKIRFVGIVWRTKNSPNTYRWHQHADWLRHYPGSVVKNVSVPGRMWGYLGNTQTKVTPTNPPWRWSEAGISTPSRDSENLRALRRAVQVFDTGCRPDERQLFSNELCRLHSMKHRSIRDLVAELR